MPQKLFLFSPAIGVSKLAMVSAFHKLLSWMPFFEKFKWLDILPEYDPCKYNSFTKNAGRQIYLLTLKNKKLISRIKKSGKKYRLPAIISFQSLVDATVIPDDLIKMYKDIGTSKDELFIFDINRVYKNFMKKEILDINPFSIFFNSKKGPKLHVLTNRMKNNSSTLAVAVYFKGEDGVLKELYPLLHLNWPKEYFAISHVAVPISSYDEIYGRNSIIGRLSAHGERDVLLISSDELIRIRYNPFFDAVKTEILNF
jgi:hypothetical protein